MSVTGITLRKPGTKLKYSFCVSIELWYMHGFQPISASVVSCLFYKVNLYQSPGQRVNMGSWRIYHKIQIISPELIFVQKAVLLGLFSGELIFGGAYYWTELNCVSKLVGLNNKNSQKHYEN